ncbi:hypothetical protein B4U80_06840 [Leptotrombidium deliense]|uniref:Uncharacterized protein n=1 Tax=Leptotrombidium deliense TaxID=299467 RepID=A0A443RYG2_9ACAR|nr:hypothetical protein B4U80_06840 [Leptotrombidium deliense]
MSKSAQFVTTFMKKMINFEFFPAITSTTPNVLTCG